jgi:ATP-binding cassette subfamily B multidrug efflux pump
MSEAFSFFSFALNLIKRRPLHYAGGIACVVILDAIDMLPALLIRNMTDVVQIAPQQVHIPTYALAIAGCYLTISILRLGWRFLLIIPSRAVEAELRNEAYEKLLHSDFFETGKFKTGDVVSTLSQDLGNIRMFMGPGILVLFDSAAYLIFIPCALFYVLGITAIWVLLPFALLVAVVLLVQKPLEKSYGQVSDHLGDLSQYIYEEAQGARFFRAEGLIEVRRKKYDLFLRTLLSRQLEISRLELGLDATLQSVIYSSYLAVLILAWLGHGAMASGLGSLVVTLQLLDKLLWPLMSINYLMNLYQQARTGSRRFSEIAKLPPKINGHEKLTTPLSHICIQNLSLDLPTGERLLKNIHLDVRAGEHIALVGKVGSGKTLLLQLLAGLWEVKHLSFSRFTFNDVSYAKLDRQTLWSQLSFIPQTPQIFGRSLALNISPYQKLHEARLFHALKEADLDADVELFPQGLKTLIGEKGMNLSGGQKQRTLIARSFHSQSRLFLWDDAISALDPQTEQKIIKNLRKLNQQAILVLATHRLSSLKEFDKIIVLDEGQIIRHGTFEEISKDSELFSMLVQDEERCRPEEENWNL